VRKTLLMQRDATATARYSRVFATPIRRIRTTGEPASSGGSMNRMLYNGGSAKKLKKKPRSIEARYFHDLAEGRREFATARIRVGCRAWPPESSDSPQRSETLSRYTLLCNVSVW
jgi:hypothetical protein